MATSTTIESSAPRQIEAHSCVVTVGTVFSVWLKQSVGIVAAVRPPLALHLLIIASKVCIFAIGEELVWVAAMTYTPEVYPVSIRGFALGVIGGVGHVGALASSLLCGILMDQHRDLPFYINAIVFALGGLTSLSLHVETCGRPIDDDLVIEFEESKSDESEEQ